MKHPWILVGVGAIGLLAAGMAYSADLGVQVDLLGDPGSFDGLYQQYGDQYGVPFTWMKAFALVESSDGQASSVQTGLADPNDVEGSKSSDGESWGLFQLTIPTASSLAGRTVTPQELNDPAFSTKLGAMLLSQLISRYGMNLEEVARDYNGGPKANDPSTVNYALTTPYVKKINAALSAVS